MDKQTETNKKENAKAAEASLLLTTEVKREPLDAQCGVSCANVYDALFDVVEHGVGDAAAASAEFSVVQVKREPSQAEAIFPADTLKTDSSRPNNSDDRTNIKTCAVVLYDILKVPRKVSSTRDESRGAVGCGTALTQRRDRAGHVDTCRKPYACGLCSYGSEYRKDLVRHLWTHTGEKPYACKVCEFKCANKRHLVTHMRTHKPYACTMCSYKCKYKSFLVGHMRSHTGEKPYACTMCSYKSNYKSNLVTHMKIHTDA